jgi:hypothetical protein
MWFVMTFFMALAAASSYDQSLANHNCKFKPEVHKDPRLDPNMSTAVLSYSFGNYRNELGRVARYKPAFADYDWFFFSDSNMSSSTIDAFVEHGWFLCGMTASEDIVKRALNGSGLVGDPKPHHRRARTERVPCFEPGAARATPRRGYWSPTRCRHHCCRFHRSRRHCGAAPHSGDLVCPQPYGGAS